jgi:hypothetical protein
MERTRPEFAEGTREAVASLSRTLARNRRSN